jgi:hypothetical protein
MSSRWTQQCHPSNRGNGFRDESVKKIEGKGGRQYDAFNQEEDEGKPEKVDKAHGNEEVNKELKEKYDETH